MYQTSYQLQLTSGLISHFPGLPRILRDGADSAAESAESNESNDAADFATEQLLMRARIRSGDYIATLATELDKMAQGLAAARAPEAPTLEKLVDELLYLDQNYTLAPRHSR